MSVQLEDLAGREMLLTGVDTTTFSRKTWGETHQDCSVINFILDGDVYSAIEDPEDGYRSCMRSIEVVTDVTVANIFEGCPVIGSMGEGTDSEVLTFTDISTGEPVLQVGTSNTDQYYPSFVSTFQPQNMASNSSREAAAAKARLEIRRSERMTAKKAELAAAQSELQQLQAARESTGWGSF